MILKLKTERIMKGRLKHYVQSVVLPAVALLLPVVAEADTRYTLVADESDLLPGCVYVLAAADEDVVATKLNGSVIGTTAFERVDESTIRVADNSNVLELLANHFDYTNGGTVVAFDRFNWGFSMGSKKDKTLAFDGTKWVNGVIVANVAEDKFYTYLTKIDITEGSGDASVIFYSAKPDRQLEFNDDGAGNLVLAPRTEGQSGGHGVKLYRKDIYDLRIIDPRPYYSKGDEIKIHVNVFDESKYNSTYLFYFFTDDRSIMTPDEAWNKAGKEGKQLKHAEYVATGGEVKITYPGGNKLLWIYHDYPGSTTLNDILCVQLREALGVTSEDAGHFTQPKATDYEMNEAVDFKQQSDVKIYYTLDGRDPVVPGTAAANAVSAQNVNAGGTEEEEGDTGAEIGDGEHIVRTYDLATRPLVFDGSTLNIRYVAVKDGYEPSAVHSLLITGTSTRIEFTEVDSNAQPVFHDITGKRIEAPQAPGIYLRTVSGKTEKIIVR